MKQSTASVQLIRYLVATALSFVLNLGLTSLMHEVMLLSEELSFGIALIVVMVNNFVMLRYYVFTAREQRILTQATAYVASSIGFRGAEYALFIIMHQAMGVHYLASVSVALVISFVSKFVLDRAMEFRTQPMA